MIETMVGDVRRSGLSGDPFLVLRDADFGMWWDVATADGDIHRLSYYELRDSELLCPATLRAGDRFDGVNGGTWTISQHNEGKNSDERMPNPSGRCSFRAACLAGHMRLVSRAENGEARWIADDPAPAAKMESDADYRVRIVKVGGTPVAACSAHGKELDAIGERRGVIRGGLAGKSADLAASRKAQDEAACAASPRLTPKDANGKAFACGEYMAAQCDGRAVIGRVVSITDEGRGPVVTLATDRGTFTLAASCLYRHTYARATRAANIDTHRIAKTHRPRWGTSFGVPTPAFLTAVDRVCAAANEGTPELLRVDTVLEQARVLVEKQS